MTRTHHYIEYWIISFFLLIPFSAFSEDAEVKGTLFDAALKIPVEMATVRLSRLPDSTFISGTASDKDGLFKLSGLVPGKYFIHITYLGYQSVYKNIEIKALSDRVDLGRLVLYSADTQLKEAVVVGKQPGVMVNNDTLEYSPTAFRTTKNAVIEDLLKKLPGVEIDEEGKILVNGQEITQVMVDGKEFFGNDPKVATKNLPVDMIERLQVVEKKSDMEELTGIDDGNRQYIINLKVKRDKKRGVFDTALAGGGTQEKYEANALVNKFSKETQLTVLGGSNNTNNMGFSDMLKGIPSQVAAQASQAARSGWGIMRTHMGGVNYADRYLDGKMKLNGNIFVANFDQDISRSLYRENFQISGFNTLHRNQWNNNKSTQFRTDWKWEYQIDKKNRLYFRPNIVWGDGNRKEWADYKTLKGDTMLLDSSYVDYWAKEKNYYLQGTLSYGHNFDKRGRNFSVDISGTRSNTNINSDSRTDKWKFKNGTEMQNPEPTYQLMNRDISRNDYRVRFYYTEPLSPTWQINVSYQFRRNNSEEDRRTESMDRETGEFELSPNQTDRSENIFYIHRIEAGIRKFWKKINLRIGATLEPTDMRSSSFRADTLFYTIANKSFNIAPYVNFVCPFSKERILRVDVWGNSQQPSPSQLQPIVDDANPNHLRVGNPDLKQSFTTRFRLRYNDYNKVTQRTIVLNMGMNFKQNSIANRTEYIEEGVQKTMPINVNGVCDGYFNFMYSMPLNPYFRLSSYTTGNYSRGISFLSDKDLLGEKSVSNEMRLYERLRVTYTNEWLEVGIKSLIRYNTAKYSLQSNMNVNAFDISNGGNVEIRFPKDITFLCDYDYNFKTGYTDGFDRPQHILRIQLNVSVFKKKQGTISLKGFDLLNQRRIVSRIVRSNYIEDLTYNTQPRYFMLQFSYRFNYFARQK